MPINPDYRHDEIAYLLDHSDAELAVVLPHRVANVAGAASERAKPLPVVDAHAMPAELPRPSSAAPRPGAPGLETECSLLYTSGTTGRPKGCLLSNFYTLNAGATYLGHGGLMRDPPRARSGSTIRCPCSTSTTSTSCRRRRSRPPTR